METQGKQKDKTPYLLYGIVIVGLLGLIIWGSQTKGQNSEIQNEQKALNLLKFHNEKLMQIANIININTFLNKLQPQYEKLGYSLIYSNGVLSIKKL